MSKILIDNGKVLIDGTEYPELMLRSAATHQPGMFSGIEASLRYVNWRTSLSGLVSAIAVFAITYPQDFTAWPWVGHIAGFVLAGGLAGMGLAAKDSNKGSNIPTTELPAHLQGTPPVAPSTPIGSTVLGVVSSGPKPQEIA